jgi:hypothetical protein
LGNASSIKLDGGNMKNRIKIIKDLLFVKTIFIFCSIVLTSIFIVFFLINGIKHNEIVFIFAPIVFFAIIYIIIKMIYENQKKEEVQLYVDKIVLYKNKKKFIFRWEDITETKIEKLFFGTDSLIMEFLIQTILKPLFVNFKIIFNSQFEVSEIAFNISKKQLKKIQIIMQLIN